MFKSMRYCPETALIQSAFFLGAKLTNLEDKSDKVLVAVKVVRDAINEVSKGLPLDGEPGFHLLPIEKQALHCKVHFWLYKTWCKGIDTDQSNGDDDDGDLDGFPVLPKFSTRLYLAVVDQMHWEQLLVEVQHMQFCVFFIRVYFILATEWKTAGFA